MVYFDTKIIHRLALVSAAALLTTACMHGASDGAIIATAALSNAQNEPGGFVAIRNSADGPTMSVEAANLAPGMYAMHFHQSGRCDAPGFTTAGSHWNPLGRQHGLSNANGPHAGDLPNIEVTSDRKALALVKLQSTLVNGEQSLFDTDGAAIVIHARADDNLTDPSGNSGERILCGVLRRQAD